MAFPDFFMASGAIIFVLVTLIWLLSLVTKDASIIDSFWGIGFVIITWVIFFDVSGNFRSTLLVTLTTIWGLRLSLHIFIRNFGKGEDFRYAAWRAEHDPRWWWRSYLQVFLLQGLLMWMIAAPLVAGQFPHAENIPRLTDYLGAALWILGFIFEAGGDYQLTRFKADPANKGKLLTTGLWKYTRHPNYFGDAAQWWGFYLISLVNGGWWTIFSPILMTFLLMRVSGVAMLERTMKTKPGYEDYKAKTSAFFPLPPKK